MSRAKSLGRRTQAASLGFLWLAACSEDPARTPPKQQPQKRAPAAPAAPAAAAAPEPRPASAETGVAADVLRLYYAMIEAGRYSQAHALREPNGTDAGAFAAHFDRFASHKATVGIPSEPAASGGWLYVEVPVQSYGSMKDGTPFGSAGTVTLRRRQSGGEWRIFTKG